MLAFAGRDAALRVREDVPSSSGFVQNLASHGRQALFSFSLANGTTEIALFRPLTAEVDPVQVLSGGTAVFTEGMAWIGHRYLISIFDSDSGSTTFETYSSGAGISVVDPGVSLSGSWEIAGTGRGQVFLSAPGELVAVREGTLQVAQSLSGDLPAGTVINTVAFQGNRLYVGGARVQPDGSAFALYGFLDPRQGTFAPLSPSQPSDPNVQSTVLSIAISDQRVVFGGQAYVLATEPTFSFYSVGAVLALYDPGPGRLTDLSGELPARFAVQAVAALGERSVGIVAAAFNFTVGTVVTPAYFVGEHPWSSLENVTGVVGSSLAVLAFETSVSGGLLFLGGLDETTGLSEVGAFSFAALDP